MSTTPTAPSEQFAKAASRKGMGLSTMLRDPGNESDRDPEPQPTATAVAEPAQTPEPTVDESAKESVAAAKPRRSSRPSAATKTPAAPRPKTVRKPVTAQIPVPVWEAWTEQLSSSRLPWRSDAAVAAMRALMELPDDELLDAVLAETTGDRGLTRQLGFRVDPDLYAQFTGRLEALGRLPINAGLSVALRRATDAGSDQLRRRVLAERRPT